MSTGAEVHKDWNHDSGNVPGCKGKYAGFGKVVGRRRVVSTGKRRRGTVKIGAGNPFLGGWYPAAIGESRTSGSGPRE